MSIPFIKKIAAAALGSIDSVLSHWLPGGKREGHEYLPLNPKRSDSKPGSFSINLRTGAWSDFATSAKGKDLVSLVAYLEGYQGDGAQYAAAEKLGEFLNIPLDKPNSQKHVKNDSKEFSNSNPTSQPERIKQC